MSIRAEKKLPQFSHKKIHQIHPIFGGIIAQHKKYYCVGKWILQRLLVEPLLTPPNNLPAKIQGENLTVTYVIAGKVLLFHTTLKFSGDQLCYATCGDDYLVLPMRSITTVQEAREDSIGVEADDTTLHRIECSEITPYFTVVTLGKTMYQPHDMLNDACWVRIIGLKS
jgi:hypothetical protein